MSCQQAAFSSLEKTIAKISEPKEVWLDTTALADYLSCTRQTIYNYRRKGLLPYHKIAGRIYFKKSEIDNSIIQRNQIAQDQEGNPIAVQEALRELAKIVQEKNNNMETTTSSVIIKDGQSAFNNYKQSIKQLQQPTAALAFAFSPFEEIAGAYSSDWMRSLINGSGIDKLNAIIREESEKEKPSLRGAILEYYREDINLLRKAVEELKRVMNVYLTDREIPYSLRNLKGLSITQDGEIDLSDDSLSEVRPLFDEMLTRPQDIEYYNLLHETADQLNKLIEESEKEDLAS